MTVTSLGYIHLRSADQAGWRRLAEDLLGLMEAPGRIEGASHYRMDGWPARLVVEPAGEPSAIVGFEVATPKALDALVEAVDSRGTKVTLGDADDCARRAVTAMASFTDPAGIALEVFYGRAMASTPFHSPIGTSFVTGGLGMGHVIVSAEDADASFAFYTDVLGFRPRNTMRFGDATLWFLGCNPRQHTLGIIPLPGPGRLVHMMFEMPTLDDVGRAIDRLDGCGIPLQQTLGRHTNDHMVSFYVVSPDGHSVEIGCMGRLIHEEEPVFEIVEGAFWGHKMLTPPASS